MILPFIEQGPMYDLLKPGDNLLPELVTGTTNKTRAEMQKTVAVFRCPTDIGEIRNSVTYRQVKDDGDVNRGLAMSNYVGVNGSNVPRQRDGDPNDAALPGNNGMFQYNASIRFAEVTDGLSNTLMLGERAFEIQLGDGTIVQSGASVIYGARGVSGTENDGVATPLGGGSRHINCPEGDNHCRRTFSSLHQGGSQFVMGDGAVVFLSENIDANVGNLSPIPNAVRDVDSVYERLLGRDDGQVVGNF